MGYLFFIVNNTLAFAVGATISDFFFKHRPLHIRLLTWTAFFPIVTLFLTLSLLTVGMLTVKNVTLLTVVLSGGILCVKNVLLKERSLPPQLLADTEHLKPKHSYLWPVILVILFLAGGMVLGLVIPGTDFSYDDFSYHATFPAHCISEQTLNIFPHDYHAYFPLNAETLSLWLMLPFHAHGFVSLTGVLWMTLAILSGLSICSTIKCSKYATLLICVLLFSSQICKSWMRTFSSVDIASTAMILAAIAVTVDYSPTEQRDEKFGRLLFSGLFAGYALGCKISFAPMCAVLCLWWLFYKRSKQNLYSRLCWVLIFIAGVFMTGSFWYIRNIVQTGNPIFPADLGPFAGPFASDITNRTKLITWILQSPFDIEQWKFLATGYTAWPILAFAISFVGYIGCFWSICFLRKKFDRPTLSAYFLIMTLGLLLLLLYPLMPFSGTADSPDAPLRVPHRFLILPWMIGIIAYSSLLSISIKKKVLWYIFGVCCIVLPIGDRTQNNCLINTAILSAGLIAMLIGKQLLSKLSSPRITVLSAIVFFAAAMIGLAPNYQRQQYRTDRKLYSYGFGKTIKDFKGPLEVYTFGIGRLPSIPDGSVITSFGLGVRYFGLFGSNYQYVPKRVSREGIAYVPWHIRWENDPENTKWWSKPSTGNIENLVGNLNESGVEYVFIRKKKTGWPIHNAIISKSEQANKIYDDGKVIIWKIR